MKPCPFCGKLIDETSANCLKCGAIFSGESVKISSECSKCGGTMQEKEIICKFCGNTRDIEKSQTAIDKIIFRSHLELAADAPYCVLRLRCPNEKRNLIKKSYLTKSKHIIKYLYSI